MFATTTNLKKMRLGDTIAVSFDIVDSYTKIPSGVYKGVFESHLYSGELYTAGQLAAQLDGVECEIIPQELYRS